MHKALSYLCAPFLPTTVRLLLRPFFGDELLGISVCHFYLGQVLVVRVSHFYLGKVLAFRVVHFTWVPKG